MASTSSSDFIFPECFPYEKKILDLESYLGLNPQCFTTLGHPLLYYAQVPQPNKKTGPNCFVKAFRWYTQERHPQGDRAEGLADRRDLTEFAEWLDEKYNHFLEEKQHPRSWGRLGCSSLNVNADTAGIPCESCTNKTFGRNKSPKRKRRPHVNCKENGSATDKSHQSLEIILEPKKLSQPASECRHTLTLSNKSNTTISISDAQASRKTVIRSHSSGKIVLQKQKYDNFKKRLTKSSLASNTCECSTEILSVYYIKPPVEMSRNTKKTPKVSTPIRSEDKMWGLIPQTQPCKHENIVMGKDKITSDKECNAEKRYEQNMKLPQNTISCECQEVTKLKADAQIQHCNAYHKDCVDHRDNTTSMTNNYHCVSPAASKKDKSTWRDKIVSLTKLTSKESLTACKYSPLPVKANDKKDAVCNCGTHTVDRASSVVSYQNDGQMRVMDNICASCCLKTSPSMLKATHELPTVAGIPTATANQPRPSIVVPTLGKNTSNVMVQTSDRSICLESNGLLKAPYLMQIICAKQLFSQKFYG